MKTITLQEALRQPRVLIVPVYEDDAVPASICDALGYDFAHEETGREGKIQRLSTLGRIAVPTLIFVGMGKRAEITYGKAKRCLGSALYACEEECCVWMDSMVCGRLDLHEATRALGLAAAYSTYRYGKAPMQVAAASDLDIADSLQEGETIGRCIVHARDLGNTPANLMRPDALAAECRKTAEALSLPIEILDADALRTIGAGALLAVGSGSSVGPRLICITYQGNGDAPFTALVGKGITFDAGGISLKPAAKMGDMIYDMSGAASVLAVVQAVADLTLPINLVAIAPACENLPSGTALKPGDIITTYSGRTVEVQNTDAEGRLILADGLTKALEHKPQLIIDVATLTGACVVALGNTYTGLFANRDDLAEKLLDAGEKTGDLAWRMPLHSDYTELMQSSYADLANVSAVRGAGASTAAAFLETFVEGTPWAHLDIAGSANTSGKDHASTGRPVALLVEFLRDFAESKKATEPASV